MSRIYFHAEDDCAEVRGSERAFFGCYVSDFTWAVLERHADGVRKWFPTTHYLNNSRTDEKDLRVALSVGMSGDLYVDGKRIEIFGMQLNTAYVMGADFVKLAARLHGQCEIHAYVEGKHRKWLAGIITAGLASGFYRKNAGWESTVELLNKSNESPVVTSYSVCDGFPNSGVAKFDGDSDAWYELPADQQWATAVAGLRKNKNGLEITPRRWNDFYFNDGENAYTLIEKMQQ